MSYTTIEFKRKYKDLNDTLFWLVQQAVESTPYCEKRWGTNNSLLDIWRIGKANLIYKKDAEGIEQIQSVGTLFENNIHNVSGAGDCDCFTVFTIAMALSSGYNVREINIVLQGRKKNQAVHIFTEIDGKLMDFTENFFNTKRKYNYIQFVPIVKFL